MAQTWLSTDTWQRIKVIPATNSQFLRDPVPLAWNGIFCMLYALQCGHLYLYLSNLISVSLFPILRCLRFTA